MSSIFGASFNFINSIVGAGVIGIPYAILQCGFVAGISLLFIVAIIVNTSVVMLIETGIKYNKLDFESLSMHLLGERGFVVVLMSMFIFAYGAQIAYMVIIGDTIPAVAHHLLNPNSIFANRPFIMISLAVLIILPLSFMRDLSSLSWSSLVSILADVVLISIVVIYAPSVSIDEGITRADVPITLVNPGLFIGLGTMSFAFVCQHNSFIVFRSLKEPTIGNWKKVAFYSIWFSFALCCGFGLTGYLCFGNFVRGDLLNNFPKDNAPIGVARTLLAFCMVLTYPMECFVARHCLTTIIRRIQSRKLANTRSTDSSSSDALNDRYARRIIAFFSPTTAEPYENLRNSFSEQSYHSTYEQAAIENHSHTNSNSHFNNNEVGQTSLEEVNSASIEIPIIYNPLSDVYPSASEQEQFKCDDASYLKVPQKSNLVVTIDDDDDSEEIILFNEMVSPSSSGRVKHREKTGTSTSLIQKQPHDQSSQNDVDGTSDTDGSDDIATNYEPLSTCEHTAMTLLLWSTSVSIAVASTDLGVVLSLTGALAASLLGYVMPAVLYICSNMEEFREAVQAFDRNSSNFTPSWIGRIKRFRKFYFCFLLIIFGIIALVVGLGSIFFQEL